MWFELDLVVYKSGWYYRDEFGADDKVVEVGVGGSPVIGRVDPWGHVYCALDSVEEFGLLDDSRVDVPVPAYDEGYVELLEEEEELLEFG